MQDKDTSVDVNEAFEDIFLAEDNLVEAGYAAGYQKGKEQGNPEGFHLGYHRGAEIGAELGYYLGFIEQYSQHLSGSGQIVDKSEKIVRIIDSIKNLICNFPKENDHSVDIIQLLENIRGKFKMVCALLKVDSSFRDAASLSF